MRPNHLFLFAAVIFMCQEVQGQFLSLEGKVGLAASNNEKIESHWTFWTAIDFRISQHLLLKIGTEFGMKKTYWQRQEEEYRGITYIGSNAQLFKSNSLYMGITYPLLSDFYVAAGISAELIRFKRIIYDPSFPFIIYFGDDRVEPYLIEQKDVLLLRPGIATALGLQLPATQKVGITFEFRYKSIFVPSDLLLSRSSHLDSFIVSSGLLWKF